MCKNIARIDWFLKIAEYFSIFIQLNNLSNSVGSFQFPPLYGRCNHSLIPFGIHRSLNLLYLIYLIYLIYLHYFNFSIYFIINLPTQDPNFCFASGPDYKPFQVNPISRSSSESIAKFLEWLILISRYTWITLFDIVWYIFLFLHQVPKNYEPQFLNDIHIAFLLFLIYFVRVIVWFNFTLLSSVPHLQTASNASI